MRLVGVLTGLAAEARIASGGIVEPHPRVGCAGADLARAALVANQLVADGAQAMLSFGIAGALTPDLRSGDVVVADRIVLPGGGTITTDPLWRQAIAHAAMDCGLSMRIAGVAGSDTVIANAAAKAELAGRSLAAAVDMESHIVAVAAQRAGLPVMAVRAIADRAEHDVPTVALDAIGPDGRARLARIIAGVWSSPSEWPALWQLGICARAGMGSLRRLVRRSGVSLFTPP